MTVGSPLLSYIDIRHRGFFPLTLTIDEAWDLDPQLIRVGSLVPARDGLVDIVFQGQAKHTSIEEQRIEALDVKQVQAESVNSLSVEVENAKDNMVVQRNMTVDQFFPGGSLTA